MIPAQKGAYLLLDAGANVECRVDMLEAFAVMGTCYMQRVEGRKDPSCALVNNGAKSPRAPRCCGRPTRSSRPPRASALWAT